MLHALFAYPLSNRGQDLGRGFRAGVGEDHDLFELVPEFVVDLGALEHAQHAPEEAPLRAHQRLIGALFDLLVERRLALVDLQLGFSAVVELFDGRWFSRFEAGRSFGGLDVGFPVFRDRYCAVVVLLAPKKLEQNRPPNSRIVMTCRRGVPWIITVGFEFSQANSGRSSGLHGFGNVLETERQNG
jgi:hypothetical protein